MFALRFAPDVPLVAVGAPAGSYYPPVAQALGVRLELPRFAEVANASDGITGLREAGPIVVTSSRLNMLGAGFMQDLDAYNAQLYFGFRRYSFNVEGLRDVTGPPAGSIASPAPINDINLVYSGVRIKF